MFTRTTSTALMRTAQLQLQQSMSQFGTAREKATSLERISKPSDDPIGTANSLAVRGEIRANDQYKRNVADGLGWAAVTDSTLGTVSDLIGRVRDLTVQGANDGAMSPTARESIAVELESLRAELLTNANKTHLGRTIFAGTSDAGVAFNDDYSFTGVPGASVTRRTDATTAVRVDVDGGAVFGQGDTSVFALVDNIVAELRSGTNVGPRLTDIDNRLEAIRGERATQGARHAQLLRAEESTLERSVALETQRSGVEDIDLASAILDLQMQEVAYQSALAVTAKVIQPTLMDFLR